MYSQVYALLRALQMPVSKDYLRLRLESHPDFPSLVAIQDTLEELQISAYACHGSRQELVDENRPFIAHLWSDGGDIRYFSSVQDAEARVKNFATEWSGNVVFAEPAKQFGNPEHTRMLKKEKRQHFFRTAAAAVLVAGVLAIAVLSGSPAQIITTLSCLAGLYFSILIAQKEMGIQNNISDKICSMAGHSRCESVLFSKGAKLLDWLSWGDIGLVYFLGALLYNAALQAGGQPAVWWYYLSVAGALFPLYSVYYQWKVVKQWCMLCIGVVAALLVNGAVAISSLPVFSAVAVVQQGIIFIGITMLVMFAWQWIKGAYTASLFSLENEIRATAMKRNPEIFNAMLEKQEQSESNQPLQEDTIQFGNPHAPVQLVIACNPYCGPCAQAHHAIESLVEKYPGKLKVAIRFALQTTDERESRTAAAGHIIRAARKDAFAAIRDWYKVMRMDQYQHHLTDDSNPVTTEIERHIAWSREAGIKATPTLFVNGRKLPELYNWADFSETLEYQLKS